MALSKRRQSLPALNSTSSGAITWEDAVPQKRPDEIRVRIALELADREKVEKILAWHPHPGFVPRRIKVEMNQTAYTRRYTLHLDEWEPLQNDDRTAIRQTKSPETGFPTAPLSAEDRRIELDGASLGMSALKYLNSDRVAGVMFRPDTDERISVQGRQLTLETSRLSNTDSEQKIEQVLIASGFERTSKERLRFSNGRVEIEAFKQDGEIWGFRIRGGAQSDRAFRYIPLTGETPDDDRVSRRSGPTHVFEFTDHGLTIWEYPEHKRQYILYQSRLPSLGIYRSYP